MPRSARAIDLGPWGLGPRALVGQFETRLSTFTATTTSQLIVPPRIARVYIAFTGVPGSQIVRVWPEFQPAAGVGFAILGGSSSGGAVQPEFWFARHGPLVTGEWWVRHEGFGNIDIEVAEVYYNPDKR